MRWEWPSTGSPDLAYPESELVAMVGTIFGAQARQDLEDLLEEGVDICESPTSSRDELGKHDENTIWLTTKDKKTGQVYWGLFTCATILYHEAAHVRSARLAGTEKDPNTGDPSPGPQSTLTPCQSCNHAKMHADEALEIAENHCPAPPETEEDIDICTAIHLSIVAARGHMSQCVQGCSGSTYLDARNALNAAEQENIQCCAL